MAFICELAQTVGLASVAAESSTNGFTLMVQFSVFGLHAGARLLVAVMAKMYVPVEFGVPLIL